MPYYTRLTYNAYDWTKPSGIEGKCSGANGELFECIYGFGFEEWYRSELFQKKVNGETWQFGYWQCFKKPKSKETHKYCDDFKVYTPICAGNCKKNANRRNILVACYKRVYILGENERNECENDFQHGLQIIQDELFALDTNVQEFLRGPDGYPRFSIKYKLADENYVFDHHEQFPIRQGGYRFGKYKY